MLRLTRYRFMLRLKRFMYMLRLTDMLRLTRLHKLLPLKKERELPTGSRGEGAFGLVFVWAPKRLEFGGTSDDIEAESWRVLSVWRQGGSTWRDEKGGDDTGAMGRAACVLPRLISCGIA